MTEGQWPKVDGDILYASEVNQMAMEVDRRIYIHNLWEITEDGLGFITEQEYNDAGVFYGIGRNSGDAYVASTCYLSGISASNDDVIMAPTWEIWTTFDTTNMWSHTTTGTPVAAGVSGTQPNRVLHLQAQGSSASSSDTITADKTNAIDFKTIATDSIIYLRTQQTHTGGNNTSANIILRLTDGTATVDLHSQNSFGSSGLDEHFYWEIQIDYSAELVSVYRNGSIVATDVDISSLTGSNWWFELISGNNNSSGSTGQTNIFGLGAAYAGQTCEFVTTTLTTSNNAITATPYALDTLNTGTITYEISSDNGVNFYPATKEELISLLINGTQLSIKALGTITSVTYKDGGNGSAPTLKSWATTYAQ